MGPFVSQKNSGEGGSNPIPHNATRKIVIRCAILKGVHLELLLISVQLIRSSSSFEPLLIIPSSAVVLN
jgi:hypothetical protein